MHDKVRQKKKWKHVPVLRTPKTTTRSKEEKLLFFLFLFRPLRLSRKRDSKASLTSPSCPDSAPAYPWRELWRGRGGVVVWVFFFSPPLPVAGEKRWYSTALIYGDGSTDHGDKHTGHVRKTVLDTWGAADERARRSQNGGRLRAGTRRNRRREERRVEGKTSPPTLYCPSASRRSVGKEMAHGASVKREGILLLLLLYFPLVRMWRKLLPCCRFVAVHAHTAATVDLHKAEGCDMRRRRYGVDSL